MGNGIVSGIFCFTCWIFHKGFWFFWDQIHISQQRSKSYSRHRKQFWLDASTRRRWQLTGRRRRCPCPPEDSTSPGLRSESRRWSLRRRSRSEEAGGQQKSSGLLTFPSVLQRCPVPHVLTAGSEAVSGPVGTQGQMSADVQDDLHVFEPHV